MTTNNESPKRGWSRLAELGPVWISAIAGLIVALTTAGFFAGRASTPDPATPQAITGTTTGGTVSSTTKMSTSAPSVPPIANTTSLASLTAVSGGFRSSNTSPTLGGQAQTDALAQDLGCTPTGDAQYNLGLRHTTLTAVVGLDDNSPDATVNPTVEFDGDGHQLGVYTPTLGHPAQITVNVSGVLRMDIKWSYKRPVTYPIPINCTPNAILVISKGELTSAGS